MNYPTQFTFKIDSHEGGYTAFMDYNGVRSGTQGENLDKLIGSVEHVINSMYDSHGCIKKFEYNLWDGIMIVDFWWHIPDEATIKALDNE